MISPETIEQYYNRAVRLRTAAAWNSFDSQRAELNWTTRPVFDADIIKLFLDPNNETEYISPVNLGVPDDPVVRKLTLGVFAKITAEFLFLSSDIYIDGKRHPGLWRAPPLISTGHAQEVMGMIQEVAKKLGQQAREFHGQTPEAVSKIVISSEEIERARTAIEAARAACELAERTDWKDGANALSAVARGVPNALSFFLEGPAVEAMRFARVVELIAPLSSSPDATDEVLSPPHSRTEYWASKLYEVKSQYSGLKNLRNLRDKVKRDATTLVQVEMLNEQAARMGRRSRYVFVTGDNTLHRIYGNWYWHLNDDPEGFVLRHPIQYIPLLNFKAMPNTYNKSDIFDELKVILDNLLWDEGHRSALAPTVAKSEFAPELRRGGFATAISPDGEERLANLGRRWWKSIELANAFNFRLAIRDDLDRLEKIFHFLGSQKVGDAIVRSQRDLLNKIGVGHLELGIIEILHSCFRDNIRHRSGGQEFSFWRLPIGFVTDLSYFVGNRSLQEYFEFCSASEPTSITEVHCLISKVQERMQPAALLIAAAAAVTAGQWGAAELFASKIRGNIGWDTPPTVQEYHDASIIKAMIFRLCLHQYDDFRSAIEILNELDSRYSESSKDDSVLLHMKLQAVSERAALRLAVFVRRKVDSSLGYGINPHESADQIGLATHDLSLARRYDEALRSALKREGSTNSHGTMHMLRVQVINNSLEHLLYQHFEGTELLPSMRREIADLASDLSSQFPEAIGSQTPSLVRLVLSVAKAIVTDSKDSQKLFLKESRAIISRILEAGNSLPQVDQDIATYFGRALTRIYAM